MFPLEKMVHLLLNLTVPLILAVSPLAVIPVSACLRPVLLVALCPDPAFIGPFLHLLRLHLGQTSRHRGRSYRPLEVVSPFSLPVLGVESVQQLYWVGVLLWSCLFFGASDSSNFLHLVLGMESVSLFPLGVHSMLSLCSGSLSPRYSHPRRSALLIW